VCGNSELSFTFMEKVSAAIHSPSSPLVREAPAGQQKHEISSKTPLQVEHKENIYAVTPQQKFVSS